MRPAGTAPVVSSDPPPTSELSIPALLQPGLVWRPTGGAISPSYAADKPVMRHQMAALHHRLHYTMAHADRLIAAAATGVATPFGGNAILDGDFAQCRSIASSLFADRCLPAGSSPLLPAGTRADEYTDVRPAQSQPWALGDGGGADGEGPAQPEGGAEGEAGGGGGVLGGVARFRRRSYLFGTVTLDATTLAAVTEKPPLRTSEMEM